jgi:hypothetical protein
MKLNVPFLYRAVGVKAGCRKPGPVQMLGWEEVEIAELGDADAPVALVARGACKWVEHEARGDLVVRTVGGRLARRAEIALSTFGYQGGRPVSTRVHGGWEDVTVENAQAVFDLWARYRTEQNGAGRTIGAPLQKNDGPWTGTFEDERAMRWRALESDDRAERAAEIRVLAARAAFVDGVLFSATDGPAWHAVVRHRHETLPGGVSRTIQEKVAIDVVSEAARLSANWHQGMFRVGDLARAEAYARGLAAERGLPYEPPPAGSLEFRDRGALEAVGDERRALLKRCADEMLEMLGNDLPNAPVAFIRAYADFKEAAAGWGADMAEDGYEAARERLFAAEALWVEEARRRGWRAACAPCERFREAVDRMRGRVHVPDAVEVGAADLRAIGLMK